MSSDDTPAPNLATAYESRLLQEFPKLRGSVPWMPLITGPTAVEPCSNIANYLGRNDVWMKRDDAIHPVFGGNKIRRFEHIFADARDRGVKEIITVGGLASTQVTATMLLGKTLGFGVTSVLFDQPVTSFARKSLLVQASSGGRLIHGGSYVRTAARTFAELWRSRKSSYFVPPGASGPLANMGYVSAAFELADQVEKGLLPKPDVIVVAAGSGGTVAALSVGLTLLGWKSVIVAVRITERFACNRATLGFLAETTKAYLGKRLGGLPRRGSSGPIVTVDHSCAGAGYGQPTSEAIAACPEVQRLIGIPGEITYSAKALVGLRNACKAYPGKTILLWNTLSSNWPEPKVRPDELPASFGQFFDGELAI